MRDQWRKSNAEHQACLIYAETKPIDAERLCGTEGAALWEENNATLTNV